MERQVVVVDVETTGLNSRADRIIQVACAKLDLRKMADALAETGQYKLADCMMVHTFNPEKRIPRAAFKVHGFTNRSVRGKPVFKDEAQELRDYIGYLPVVGHNVAFDKRFLNAEFKRAGIKTLSRNKSYCTMNWYIDERNGGQRKGSNLNDAAYDLLGTGRSSDKHDAAEDVALCAALAAYCYASESGLPLPAPSEGGETGTGGIFWGVLFVVALLLGTCSLL